jgi:hypothetical protein
MLAPMMVGSPSSRSGAGQVQERLVQRGGSDAGEVAQDGEDLVGNVLVASAARRYAHLAGRLQRPRHRHGGMDAELRAS